MQMPTLRRSETFLLALVALCKGSGWVWRRSRMLGTLYEEAKKHINILITLFVLIIVSEWQ